jgi:hypothetical protein
MGLHYFSQVDPSKHPLEGKVHVTFANSSITNGTNDSEYHKMLANGTTGIALESSFFEEYSSTLSTIAMTHVVSFVSCINLFWCSLLWISLTTRQLVSFYTYLLAFSCVPLSYMANLYTIDLIKNRDPMLDDEPAWPLSRLLGK